MSPKQACHGIMGACNTQHFHGACARASENHFALFKAQGVILGWFVALDSWRVHPFHANQKRPMGQGQAGCCFALGLSQGNVSWLCLATGPQKPPVRARGLRFGQIRLDPRMGQRQQNQPSHLQRPKRNGGRKAELPTRLASTAIWFGVGRPLLRALL